jgi:hypothetical protein
MNEIYVLEEWYFLQTKPSQGFARYDTGQWRLNECKVHDRCNVNVDCMVWREGWNAVRGRMLMPLSSKAPSTTCEDKPSQTPAYGEVWGTQSSGKTR